MGVCKNKNTLIEVKILNSENNLVVSKNIALNLEEPFSSKNFFR